MMKRIALMISGGGLCWAIRLLLGDLEPVGRNGERYCTDSDS
jgi:hypothetical protein